MWVLPVFIYFFILKVTHSQYIVTTVNQGSLKGLERTTLLNGKPYFSFKGIPYAKPPTGARKFDPPAAADPWTGEYDATEHKSSCVFYCMIRSGIMGEEDCLYLNVYTPDINQNAKKAVMVFIHPGGFNGGTSNDEIFGPDFLIEQDVVVVTFNSRLGVHGFLSTADEHAPGNAGLKDQVMALNWIKDNIMNFGGCPNRVTVFGMDSGAVSIQYHMQSPLSRNLFRAAIMESGSILNPVAIDYNPRQTAFKLAEVLGVKATDTKELVNKLRTYTVKELVTAGLEVSKTSNHVNGRMAAFLPVVEPDAGQDIFLSNDPWTAIKNNNITDIPVIMGVNLDETGFFAPLYLSNAEMLDQNFELFLPDDLNATSERQKDISETVRKFYFDGKSLTTNSEVPFTMMTSDVFYNLGVLISSKIIGNRNKSPVYKYLFSYESSIGFMKNVFKMTKGVGHGDELTYLFYSTYFKNNPERGSNEEKMIRVLTKLWSNFAKEMNPTPNLDDDLTVSWETMGTDDNYLNINLPMKMEKDLFKERINMWAQIYNDVLGDYTKLFK